MLKKFCKLTILGGMLLPLFFTSCWGKKSKGEVRYLNFKPESAGVYEELAQIYEKETGVKVIIETAANNAYESTLTAKMANRNPPTLFQINGPKGYANWKDYCADLKDSELYKHLTDKSLAVTDKGGVYGIPYVLEGYGIIYNKEITDKYFALSKKATTFKSMDEINNFEKLKKLVEDMQKNASKLGIKGVFASTSLKAGEDWRWQTHLLNIPIYYEFTNNNIDLTSNQTDTITFEYNKNFKNIFDLYLNNSVIPPKQVGIKTVDNSMSEFALGECAMVQNGNWAWSQIEGVKGNVVKADNIKYLPIYTGMKVDPQQGLCIGTENFYAVNKKASAEDQKATVDFVYWLYSSEKGKDYVINKLGFISPFDTFTEFEKPKDPLAVEVLHWMKKSDITTIPWYFTLFPSQVFKEDFGSDLLRYAQGSEKWATVTENVIADWKKESAASQ
ncbi:MAG: ABC transporter substrate-binding protein [Treponema sp.]|nr:ABC transporter substrate-binding protein [Treponema sp.]